MKQNEAEGTQQVVRVSPASYGIVKVTLSGTAHYLLQLNKHRGVYNFISGHVEADEDEGYFDRAMDREQVEELEGAGFTHSDMAYRVLPSPLVEIDRSSDRYPGLTRYLFKLYQLCFSLSAEELYARAKEDPENAWFT